MTEKEWKIYTKGGDTGNTSLIGGTRVPKSHIRVEAYGTIDELVAFLGVIRDYEVDKFLRDDIIKIQERLFTAEAWIAADSELATHNLPVLYEEDITYLEKAIDTMNEQLPTLANFILPGGHPAVSCIHVARTVCRRAERTLVRIMETEIVNPLVVKYLNRLSDYLFVASRITAKKFDVEQVCWIPTKTQK